MSVGNEDVAIWSGNDIGGLIEGVRAVAGYTHLAERQQDFSFGTELDDDVALPGRGLSRRARGNSVSHPDVSLPVHVDPMSKDEHPFAKALHEFARRIEFEHDWQV